MEMTERVAATLGAKPEVDKVVAAGRSAPPTMKRKRDLMHETAARALLAQKGGKLPQPNQILSLHRNFLLALAAHIPERRLL